VWGAADAFLFLEGRDDGVPVLGRGAGANTLADGVPDAPTRQQPQNSSGGNMEGKRGRFGSPNTALSRTATTDAGCGAINGWHDSLTPRGGRVPARPTSN